MLSVRVRWRSWRDRASSSSDGLALNLPARANLHCYQPRHARRRLGRGVRHQQPWRGRGPVQDRRRADARLRLPGRRDGRSRDAAGRRRQRCGGATIAAEVAKSMRGVLHAYRWADDAMIDVVGSPSSLWTEVPMGSTTRVDRWRAGRPRVPPQERRNAGSWNVARRQGEPGSWHQRLGPGHRRDLEHRALQRPDPGLLLAPVKKAPSSPTSMILR